MLPSAPMRAWPSPRLTWRRRAGEASTGVTRRHEGMIAVRAGNDPLDQRLTLLHELAHWLAPGTRRRRGRTEHHGRAFYRVAFALYQRHGVPPTDALRLESGRYRSSLAHAVALAVPGARDLLAAHRAALRARPRRSWRVLIPEHPIRLVPGWPLERVRDVPSARRRQQPRSHPPRAAARPPRAHDLIGFLASTAASQSMRPIRRSTPGLSRPAGTQARAATAGTRSRASAAASARRETASGVRGKTCAMRCFAPDSS